MVKILGCFVYSKRLIPIAFSHGIEIVYFRGNRWQWVCVSVRSAYVFSWGVTLLFVVIFAQLCNRPDSLGISVFFYPENSVWILGQITWTRNKVAPFIWVVAFWRKLGRLCKCFSSEVAGFLDEKELLLLTSLLLRKIVLFYGLRSSELWAGAEMRPSRFKQGAVVAGAGLRWEGQGQLGRGYPAGAGGGSAAAAERLAVPLGGRSAAPLLAGQRRGAILRGSVACQPLRAGRRGGWDRVTAPHSSARAQPRLR